MIDKSLSRKELQQLYNQAKEAYYNGEEIMSDADFDELESLLGLENKSYVGSKNSKKLNYTCKHSFIMGSLSKIQIKEDTKTGQINWEYAAETITKFLNKSSGTSVYETTPKLDGCSFSTEFINVGGKAVLKSCATRGDGTYGKDIRNWFLPQLKTDYWSKIDDAVNALCEEDSDDILCIRGEILIPQTTFGEEYSSSFTNPRSFVAGTISAKWDDNDDKLMSNVSNLHFVCYDYRTVDADTQEFTELSWMNPSDPTYKFISKYLNHIGELPDKEYCQVHDYNGSISVEELQEFYNEYDVYRKHISPYALDGIVIKPAASSRKYNDNKARPDDCIAMKFLPMLNPTEIVDIQWKVGKTGEYSPVAILKPIYLDGKKIVRASLHNYGYIISQGAGIGAMVQVVLSGDIIPQINHIIKPSKNNNSFAMPHDSYIKDNIHLMKKMENIDVMYNKFCTSIKVLNINGIGNKIATKLFFEIKQSPNILDYMNNHIYDLIYNKWGNTKTSNNIINALQNKQQILTLPEIIESCSFENCGPKNALWLAKKISGLNITNNGIPSSIIKLAESTEFNNIIKKYIRYFSIPLFVENKEYNKIPIIMTGDTSNTRYKTKKDWIHAHPQYIETTSWKDCKILFTNDLNSKSGKMLKAKKYNIEIKIYSD